MGDIEKYGESTFEQYKKINEYEQEFWYARDMQQILQYKEWRNFVKVIEKARIASESSNQDVVDHFVDVNKMVQRRSKSQKND